MYIDICISLYIHSIHIYIYIYIYITIISHHMCTYHITMHISGADDIAFAWSLGPSADLPVWCCVSQDSVCEHVFRLTSPPPPPLYKCTSSLLSLPIAPVYIYIYIYIHIIKLISSLGGHMRWTSTVTWGPLGPLPGAGCPSPDGLPLAPTSRWCPWGPCPGGCPVFFQCVYILYMCYLFIYIYIYIYMHIHT